jgi:hypothetical protein
MCPFSAEISVQPLCRDRSHSATNPDFHVFFTMRKIKFHGAFLWRLRISRSFNGGNFALRLIEER